MISQIQTDFYRITLRMPYRLKHVHAYLLVQDKELVLFDTGLNIPGAYEMLEKDLASAGFSVNDIRHIFLTHVHTDHCSVAGLLQKNTDAKIYLSAAAFDEYQHFRKADSAVEQLKKFYSRQGMSSQQINMIIEEYEDIRSIITEFHADDFLQNNEIREFGKWNFEVIFTPGHAAGHVCFFFRKESFLLAGDHILPYIAPILSPDIFNDDFRPLATYLDSLSDIEKLPIATIYPGHGNAFIDFKERLEEIRRHHIKRKKMVFDHLSAEPKTTYAVSHEIFGAIKEDMIDNVLVYTA